MEHLKHCHVTSLAELQLLPGQIEKFKEHFGFMGRKWYKEFKMPKEPKAVKVTMEQLAHGWFQDTVTDNLFLCCRLIKDNPHSDFYTNLTTTSIESAREANTELNTYNDEKKFNYMVHLSELTSNMDSLKACKITTFDDLLRFSDTFDEFKKQVTTKQLDRHVIDKLFVCTRLIQTNITRDIFTAVAKDKFAEELRLLNSKRSLQQTTATKSTMRCDAVALSQNLKHMLDSKEIPDNVRKTLRNTLSVFLKKFHRDYENTAWKNSVTYLLCTQSTNT